MQDADLYTEESVKQLSDSRTYIQLKGDPTMKYKSSLTTLIQKGINFIQTGREVIILQAPIVPIFYHLPKTHKGLKGVEIAEIVFLKGR